MIAATNNKREKYKPVKWMMNGAAISKRAAAEKEPMTGEQIIAKFKSMGIRVIDKRKKAQA
jgi:hypothetical protein